MVVELERSRYGSLCISGAHTFRACPELHGPNSEAKRHPQNQLSVFCGGPGHGV